MRLIEKMGIYEELNGDYLYTSECKDDMVAFYIGSKLYDDKFGIVINSDGTFYPIISTNNCDYTDEAKQARIEFIKEFVYDILKIRINFGTVDGVNKLRIPELYNRALDYVSSPYSFNSNVTYIDGGSLVYSNAGPKM